jgi:hypothetical protein
MVVQAIDDDRTPPPGVGMPAEAPGAGQPVGADMAAALGDLRLRAAVATAAPVLADAARSLDPWGQTALARDGMADTPDDDRAAGRLAHLRHDLMGV